MVIWADMQINISHLQPLLGGARGQKDEVQPIRGIDLDCERSGGGPARVQLSHRAPELGVIRVIKSQEGSVPVWSS